MPPQDATPVVLGHKLADTSHRLMQTDEHELCPGCGHPVAWRLLLEVLDELDLVDNSIGVVGHGCYTSIIKMADVEFLQCLHGRAPAVATGVKRMLPDRAVYTLQGDGDMASEGLAEVLHTAARGERITCIMLNNGVFGDTGGQMTAASVVGQRTKTSTEGRDPEVHGYPVPVADLIARLPGTVYAARGAVYSAGTVARTKKLLHRAFQAPLEEHGTAFIEILTMCPTGWFLPASGGPEYLTASLESEFPLGELALTRDAQPAETPGTPG